MKRAPEWIQQNLCPARSAVTRLGQALTYIDQTRRFSLRAVVRQYDWREQVQVYDRLFHEL